MSDCDVIYIYYLVSVLFGTRVTEPSSSWFVDRIIRGDVKPCFALPPSAKLHYYTANIHCGWAVLCPCGQPTNYVYSCVYRITSKYSNALRTSQTCNLAKCYHILHLMVALEAPCSCARDGLKQFHDVILHPSLNQC